MDGVCSLHAPAASSTSAPRSSRGAAPAERRGAMAIATYARRVAMTTTTCGSGAVGAGKVSGQRHLSSVDAAGRALEIPGLGCTIFQCSSARCLDAPEASCCQCRVTCVIMSTHPRGSWCRARYVSLVRKTQRFLLFELFLERQPKQFAADPSRKVFDERAPQSKNSFTRRRPQMPKPLEPRWAKTTTH